MIKYEYKVIQILKSEEEKEKILNEHGQQGWELVCVNGALHYMKRIVE